MEILPGKRTLIWGYDGTFPGPTIRVDQGRRTVIRHVNRLNVSTVVHLHGSATASDSDGFPTDSVLPGQSRTYRYPNERAATLWYHDHSMDHTGRNIFMGLAGMYIVEAKDERNLPLPRGEHDVPLILQDRLFSEDGELVYRPDCTYGPITETLLVNGVPYPNMEVSACKYRFRILNGSNAKAFHLRLSSGFPFIQIATDGGLLAGARSLTGIPLAMAERAEVIIDFSQYLIGSRITLDDVQARHVNSIMQFQVVRKATDQSRIPQRLHDISTFPVTLSPHRTFVFTRGESNGSCEGWSINGDVFDPDRAIAEVRAGSYEVWRLANHSFRERQNVVHPIHVHLVNFHILERNGGPPLAHEIGPKDTVALNVGDDVLIGMRVDDFKGRYLFHCHNLAHEDHGMMARFDSV